jgi:hypothetical protein
LDYSNWNQPLILRPRTIAGSSAGGRAGASPTRKSRSGSLLMAAPALWAQERSFVPLDGV